ncbi:hypothetical protein [Streptomyces natalensis]|uniref:Uncharacterized protein n=1 Tax=Streptomyces natalensis ATCC 27448 TaxID=1240678 RepID=A0A0D7CJW4_9ACTN|nr:hypothetical protein [Streptomyces natalensis]KIZ16498.1 hypothetical protein SNA_19430 [Streptomyces natalensis ATCC 27448]
MLLLLGIVALMGLLLRWAWTDFRYATARSGTPGTFSAIHCHTIHQPRGGDVHPCTGTFVATEGGFTDHSAHLDDNPVGVGKPLRLLRESDGSYHRPLVSTAVLDVAAAFGIVWAAAVGAVMVCVGSRRVSVGGGSPARSKPHLWASLQLWLTVVAVGSVAAGVLSLVVGIVIALTGH